jgi:hypothetical protein
MERAPRALLLIALQLNFGVRHHPSYLRILTLTRSELPMAVAKKVATDAGNDSDSSAPAKRGRKSKTAKKGAKRTTRAQSQGDEPSAARAKSTIKYPPYVNAYGSIPTLFTEIERASVPPKVTQDFVESVLGLKSSSHRALIPLLKRLGFIDAANVPTDAYRRFRDPSQAPGIMAERVRDAYADIYRANEYAHTLNKEQLTSKLRTLTGAAGDDPYIPSVAATFLELAKLADFGADAKVNRAPEPVPAPSESAAEDTLRQRVVSTGFGFSYTINLNLPATTEIDVFNAIFKSLKEHLLDAS